MTELQISFMAYPKDEQMYMLELDKMSKVDLILWLNNLNNIRKIEAERIEYEERQKKLKLCNTLWDLKYKANKLYEQIEQEIKETNKN